MPPQEYDWNDVVHVPSHRYLWPTLNEWMRELDPSSLLDIGCGDGRLTDACRRAGLTVVGVDSASSAIIKACSLYPETEFRRHDLSAPLPADLRERFDLAVAVEVIEHLFLPRALFARADEALRPGGHLIITTPYHGYLKNLLLGITGRWDRHFGVMWDYGHIKFFSPRTLVDMADEAGFEFERLRRVGRSPAIAASMAAQFVRR